MATLVLSGFLKPGTIRGPEELKLISGILDLLLQIMPHPAYQMQPAELTRLTRNASNPGVGNDRIKYLKHLIFPPEGAVTKFGRCNIPKSSVFYSSFHFITNMKEVHVQVGDVVTHSKWKMKDSAGELNIFPIFYLTNLDGRPHNGLSLDLLMMHRNYLAAATEEEKEYMNIIGEFLAKCFAKVVDLNNHLDYYLSAYLSDRILANSAAQYDGILYPSVQDRLGTSNVVLTQKAFLNNFEPTEVTHDILISVTNGGAMFDGIHHTRKFDLSLGIQEGTIIWDD